jgi:nucleoside-diphosphate-sugar epimerase
MSGDGARRILIAGCGYVGSALGRLLAADGWRVFGLRRDPRALAPPIEALGADLAKPAELRAALAACPGLHAVVYAAAAERRDPAAYRAAYRDGLAGLLEALAARGERPRRVIFTSSTAVYAQDAGELVDEDSPAEPVAWNGSVMLETERALAAGPFPGIALRLGGIYGPGRGRLVRAVRSGDARLRGHPHYTNRIHRDDAAGALRHLLALEDPAPLYLGVDREPADEADVLCWLAREVGAPEPRAEESGSKNGPAAGKRCSSARLVASGYRFLYPSFREGYAELIRTEPA